MNRPHLQLHDFCIPINPYFPTRDLINDMRMRLGDILTYYPSDNQAISRLLGDFLGLDSANIVVANGSNANFVYCEVDASIPGGHLRDVLLQQFGYFVRECGSKTGSGSQFLRIAARPEDQQPCLTKALQDAITSIQRDGVSNSGWIDRPV